MTLYYGYSYFFLVFQIGFDCLSNFLFLFSLSKVVVKHNRQETIDFGFMVFGIRKQKIIVLYLSNFGKMKYIILNMLFIIVYFLTKHSYDTVNMK